MENIFALYVNLSKLSNLSVTNTAKIFFISDQLTDAHILRYKHYCFTVQNGMCTHVQNTPLLPSLPHPDELFLTAGRKVEQWETMLTLLLKKAFQMENNITVVDLNQ